MVLTQIGSYRIESELGHGTAGTVYRATSTDNGAVVAIKLLSPEMSREETMQRRFVREMKVMSKLQHPHIVKYIDGGLESDRFYYVMELLDTMSLKQSLAQRHTFTWREAVECGIQICDALQCTHDAGIIHRDLKPANIFLSQEGILKLGDFGLAKDLSEDRLTMEGFTVGTCRYMSPEQSVGDSELGGATDLYSLGCLLFEMLTGRVPFDGATVFEIITKHHDEAPGNVKMLHPSCPKNWQS